VPSKAFEWSNGTYSLLLDATLELDFSLDDEDFTELLLDFAELLDATLEEDFALLDVMPADVPASPFLLLLDTLVSPSLDCGVTLEEDFAELLDATLEEDFTLLLDFALDDVGESQSSQTDEDESSASGLMKLPLSSSPHAAKNANTAPTANNLANFMFLPQIISPKYNQKGGFSHRKSVYNCRHFRSLVLSFTFAMTSSGVTKFSMLKAVISLPMSLNDAPKW